MKYILLLCITIIISSCVTQNACNRKFPPTSKDSIYTIVQDSLHFVHDTTITYLRHDSIIHHHDTLTIYKAGKIIHVTDTIIKIKTIRTVDDRTKTSPPIITNKTPVFATFCEWGFLILLILIILAFVWEWIVKKIPF